MIKKILYGTGNYNVLILAGVHGNELSPVYCASLCEKLNGALYKKLTILNLINEYGIINGVREFNNNNDLNRIFSDEYTIEHQLKDEIINSNPDVIFDLHASPNVTNEFALVSVDDYSQCYMQFFSDIGKNAVLYRGAKNTIKAHHSINKSIPSFTIEMDGMNEVNVSSAEYSCNMIDSILSNLEFLELSKMPLTFKESHLLYAPVNGIFIDYNLIDEYENATVTLKITYIDMEDGFVKIQCITDFKGQVFQFLKGYHAKDTPIALVQEYEKNT